MTTTPCCHHVFIIFKDNVLFVIKVEEIEGLQFIWHTAGHANILRQFQCINNGLNCSMVCRI